MKPGKVAAKDEDLVGTDVIDALGGKVGTLDAVV